MNSVGDVSVARTTLGVDRKLQLLEQRLSSCPSSIRSPNQPAQQSIAHEESNSASCTFSPSDADVKVVQTQDPCEIDPIVIDNENENNSHKSDSRRKEEKHAGSKRSCEPNPDSSAPTFKSPKQGKSGDHDTDQVHANQDSGSRGAGGTSGGSMRTIQSYFAPQDHTPLSASVGMSAASLSVFSMSGESETAKRDKELKAVAQIPKPSTVNAAVASSVKSNVTPSNQVAELKKLLETSKLAKDSAEAKSSRLESDLKVALERTRFLEERNVKLCKNLEDLYRQMALQDARRRRDRLALDCVRLGKITCMRTGPASIQEVWEEGYALKELNKKSAELLERKEELERRRKRLQTQKRAAKKGASGSSSSSGSSSGAGDEGGGGGGGGDDYEVDLDLTAEADAIRSHLEQLKRDEMALVDERRLLESEKAAHQKEIKRCQGEDRSRFLKDLPCLNSRYLLMSLLGRGGFSEVWKAFDFLEFREVAVKVHQLNPTWTEERKYSYIKHVTREYTIHRELQHPRVVQFFDVFEIDINSFATVLEYCRGIDLDEKLKRQRMIPEKDARTILLQIVSGLRYLSSPTGTTSAGGSGSGGGVLGGLGSSNGKMSSDSGDFASAVAVGGASMVEDLDNELDGGQAHVSAVASSSSSSSTSRRKAIIHFDLKPANILFDEMGDAKITDFGLSKIIDEDGPGGNDIELTSQGAGTYWYLPPECFAKGADAPRISPKVDIWSLGVIYFQMLFGKRPFGEGKSQERVLSEGIILNATQVDFPSPSDPKAPKVSDEAKDFIRACLTPDQRFRPDIHALQLHPHLRNK